MVTVYRTRNPLWLRLIDAIRLARKPRTRTTRVDEALYSTSTWSIYV